MARFRKGLSLRPVNRIKHVVDVQGGVVGGTPSVTNLVFALNTPALANVSEVITGSTVNGIYLHVEAYATNTATLANFYMMIYKNVGGNTIGPPANAVGASDNKRFVIHQEMVMLEKNTTGNPRTVFNGVVVLPRGYRRFGPDDRLEIHLLSPGVTADFCYEAIYKEFR